MKRLILLFFTFLFSVSQFVQAQMHAVAGIVRDEKGKPVPSATIQVKDVRTGTITDSSGLFNISVNADALLVVSRIGFADTSVALGDQNNISIVLRSTVNTLNNVSVKSAVRTDPQQTGAVSGTIHDQAVSNGLEDLSKSSYSTSTPVRVYANTSPQGIGTPVYSGKPIAGGINYGGAVPVFSAVKETKGSRYLFTDWVTGKLVTQSGSNTNSSDLLFNYDKTGKTLLVTADRKILIEVNKTDLLSFTLKNNEGEEYEFSRVNAISPDLFYQPLVKSASKYSFYKLLITKFVVSDYHSDGLVETGTPYDEYVDSYEYYIVMPDGKTFQKLPDLKSKSIKAALSGESAKVDEYFSQHKHESVNEYFVSDLVNYLNK